MKSLRPIPGMLSAMAVVTSPVPPATIGTDDAGSPVNARGPAIEASPPPRGSDVWSRACSVRHRFCVRAPQSASPALGAAAIASTDQAWEALTGPLGLPEPEGPYGARWELYLVDRTDGPAALRGDAEWVDRQPDSHFDRASSFGLIDRRPAGCALDLDVARAIARGSIWRAAPGTDPASARSESEMLARLATPCVPPGQDDDVAAFQAEPARCIVDPSDPSYSRGASLFFDWLDRRFGRGPGALIGGLWALAPTVTPSETWQEGRWAGTPTGFDVMRVSLRDALWQASTLEDVFVDFAIWRASVPGRAAAPAWHVPWPTVARRLASVDAVAPTGASYVVVDHAGAPAGAQLRLEAEWEAYARMRWVVVKLDADGHALAQIPIRSLDRTTHASMTVAALDGVARALIVAVNVGSTEHPFDPDQGEWEPHGWVLTIAGE